MHRIHEIHVFFCGVHYVLNMMSILPSVWKMQVGSCQWALIVHGESPQFHNLGSCDTEFYGNCSISYREYTCGQMVKILLTCCGRRVISIFFIYFFNFNPSHLNFFFLVKQGNLFCYSEHSKELIKKLMQLNRMVVIG